MASANAIVIVTTSHSQRLNRGKPLGTGCCGWLWSIGTVAKRGAPIHTATDHCRRRLKMHDSSRACTWALQHWNIVILEHARPYVRLSVMWSERERTFLSSDLYEL